jgi:hypothetical protein
MVAMGEVATIPAGVKKKYNLRRGLKVWSVDPEGNPAGPVLALTELNGVPGAPRL